MKQVPLKPEPSTTLPALDPGRGVVILLRSGEKVSGTVVTTDEHSLTLRSKPGAIRGLAYQDMESLHISRISVGRTAAVIGGAVVVLGAAVVYLNCVKSSCDNSD